MDRRFKVMTQKPRELVSLFLGARSAVLLLARLTLHAGEGGSRWERVTMVIQLDCG